MINKKISSKILTVAPHYIKTLGGMSHVIKMYSEIYEDFHFVASTRDGSLLVRILQTIYGLSSYLWFMPQKDIKIVHIHGASKGSFWRKAIFIYLAKIFNKKVIYHIHGGGFKNFYKKHPYCVRHTLNKCDLIIALSENWMTFFKSIITNPENVEIIDNIIPKPIIINNKRVQEYCSFLFMGQINKAKGIYDILEVLRDNKAEYSGKLKCLLGGIGEIEEVQKQIKKFELEDLVFCLGWVSGEKKQMLLAQSDVYLLPSYFEGLPISILEAMSYKLPIIATNVGGIPEIVLNSQNGLLITPGDQQALKESIDKMLLSDLRRKEMGEISYQLSKKHFPNEIEKRLILIYENLLNK